MVKTLSKLVTEVTHNHPEGLKGAEATAMAIFLSFVLQLLIIYLPQLQIIFRTTSIGLIDWTVIVIVAFTIIIAEKIMNKVIT